MLLGLAFQFGQICITNRPFGPLFGTKDESNIRYKHIQLFTWPF